MKRNLILSVVTLLLTITAAQAGNAPKRKPGLWEISTTNSAAPGANTTFQQCIDAATDDLVQRRGQEMAQQKCSKQDFRVSGNTVTFESVCMHGNTVATTSGTFSGQFDSAYRGEMTTRFEPPMRGVRESRTSIAARWLGACQPGQRPGDMIMPGMGGANINDMMRGNPQMEEMMRNNPQMREMVRQRMEQR